MTSSELSMLSGLTLKDFVIKHAAEQHENNKKWWVDLATGERKERNKGEQIALIHSEISEAFNGLYEPDDKLPEYNGAAVEIVDALIRVFDFIGGWGYDLNNPVELGEYAFVITSESSSKLDALDHLFLHSHSATSHLLEALRKDKPEDVVVEELLNLVTFLLMSFDSICEVIASGELDVSGKTFKVASFEEILKAKSDYNLARQDHSLEHRKNEGGKKF